MYDFSAKHGLYLKKPVPLLAGPHLGLKGEFRAILRNKKGEPLYDSGWNRNLIVDNAGFNYDSGNWYQWCSIGSDGTAPSVGDVAIGSFLASESSNSNPMPYIDYPRPPVAPFYERYSIRVWRFDAGEGTGTVREFTLGTQNNGTDIFCRHVLPAAIPKDVDQSLDIYYRITIYPDLTSRNGQVTIDGVLYDWETSLFDLDLYNTNLFARQDFSMTFNTYFQVFDGAAAGPLDAAPSGNQASGASMSFVTQGAWYRTQRFYMGLDQCNTATNMIRVFRGQLQTAHRVQIEISDNATGLLGLPKDNTKEAYIDWKLTWGRYP